MKLAAPATLLPSFPALSALLGLPALPARPALPALLVLLLAAMTQPDHAAGQQLDAELAERFGSLALSCAHQEYPNKIAHVLQSDADVAPPRDLTPAFYGCYDWHSSVHGHWLLTRLARLREGTELAERARAALARSLTPENIAGEVAYLEGEGRTSFERPYGLAWLLQLAAELREWDDPHAREWARTLEPLEQEAADRIREWLPKLTHPIRGGEHSQTAFAFGLIRDWAVTAGDRAMLELLDTRIRDLYLDDRACPLAYEPSGQDFLSPCLAEADLMRRVLEPTDFAAWLGAFLPQIPLSGVRGENGAADAAVEVRAAAAGVGGAGEWLEPALVTDPGDPKLAHLDGLNLSRAWMLEGIMAGLPAGDPRLPALEAAAEAHRAAGYAAVTGAHYEGGHWLGSFAMYLATRRGIE